MDHQLLYFPIVITHCIMHWLFFLKKKFEWSYFTVFSTEHTDCFHSSHSTICTVCINTWIAHNPVDSLLFCAASGTLWFLTEFSSPFPFCALYCDIFVTWWRYDKGIFFYALETAFWKPHLSVHFKSRLLNPLWVSLLEARHAWPYV